MTFPHVPASVRRLVMSRAHACCEYCLLDSAEAEFPHEIDHYVPVVHGGKSDANNLVFSCMKCNRHKGTNIAAFDPLDGTVIAVFNPRKQTWRDHFALVGAYVIGVTATGRATVALLHLNEKARVERRAALIEAGRYPRDWSDKA